MFHSVWVLQAQPWFNWPIRTEWAFSLSLHCDAAASERSGLVCFKIDTQMECGNGDISVVATCLHVCVCVFRWLIVSSPHFTEGGRVAAARRPPGMPMTLWSTLTLDSNENSLPKYTSSLLENIRKLSLLRELVRPLNFPFHHLPLSHSACSSPSHSLHSLCTHLHDSLYHLPLLFHSRDKAEREAGQTPPQAEGVKKRTELTAETEWTSDAPGWVLEDATNCGPIGSGKINLAISLSKTARNDCLLFHLDHMW